MTGPAKPTARGIDWDGPYSDIFDELVVRHQEARLSDYDAAALWAERQIDRATR